MRHAASAALLIFLSRKQRFSRQEGNTSQVFSWKVLPRQAIPLQSNPLGYPLGRGGRAVVAPFRCVGGIIPRCPAGNVLVARLYRGQ